MTHAYAHLHGLPTTCFRFFTVYGPWGRPDMALFRFAAAIEKGEPIDVYGEGRMRRDFTYLDDLVEAAMGRSAEKRLLPMQPGDVRETHAAPDLLRALTGQVPETPIAEGIGRFVEWYRAYTA